MPPLTVRRVVSAIPIGRNLDNRAAMRYSAKSSTPHYREVCVTCPVDAC